MFELEQARSFILQSKAECKIFNNLMHQAIEDVALQSPDCIAIVHGDQSITYKLLNARANQLGRYLIKKGISPRQPVAIMMHRSINCIIALLAILKVGAYYVPIDIRFPRERIALIFKKAKIEFSLVDNDFLFEVANFRASNHITMDDSAISTYAKENIDVKVNVEDPAYCIYTSGSTGEPKGVLICHKSLTNYCMWSKNQYATAGINNFAFYSSLAFDLTVTSIFVPLISNGTIFIYDDSNDDIPVINTVMQDNQVDFLKLTPSHLMLIKNRDFTGSKLKVLVLGGEDLKSCLAREIFEKFNGNIRIYNEYGPTEATVGCTFHLYQPAKDVQTSVPIGRPITHTTIYLLNKHLDPVKLGEIGQIYIAGEGLAMGYNHNDALTQRMFLTNPFKNHSRLYASGDYGKINNHGDLIYLGRKDSQIKLRGYRVELGEVESALLTHPKIKDCTVVSNSFFYERHSDNTPLTYCSKCGVPSNFPNITFSKAGICNHCINFLRKQTIIDNYFRSLSQLQSIFQTLKEVNHPKYDCIVALSGGKDSVYALCQIVDMGMRVFAFTFDNGYLSQGAKLNIQRTIDVLGIDHEYMTTEHTKPIFLDSLKRYSDVCHGCFKVIYTFAIDLAKKLGVKCILTGLSRGQLFETRISEILRSDEFNEEAFEKNIVNGRKIYHRVDDPVKHLLRPSWTDDDNLFDSIQFVDFYRYCDVARSEIYAHIKKRIGWIKPADTGKSSNCLLNDVAVYVHNKERGFHKYALPLSWEVRTGHVSKKESIQEIEAIDKINEEEVSSILNELGYKEEPSNEIENTELIAYCHCDTAISNHALRTYLLNFLPPYMVPSKFIFLDTLPLTPSGKINRSALPKPVACVTQIEKPQPKMMETMTQLWKEVLMISDVGMDDNFFEIGGHSLAAVMLLFKIDAKFNTLIPLEDFSKQPTINALLKLVFEKQSN